MVLTYTLATIGQGKRTHIVTLPDGIAICQLATRRATESEMTLQARVTCSNCKRVMQARIKRGQK